MVCYNCGASVKEGIKFCTSCGAKLKSDIEHKQIPHSRPTQVRRRFALPSLNVRNRTAWLILAPLLLIILSLSLFFYYMQSPRYSLRMIKKAIRVHDSDLFLEYVDTNRVCENLIQSLMDDSPNNTSSNFANALVYGMTDLFKEQLRKGLINEIEKPDTHLGKLRVLDITKRGKIATIKVKNIENKETLSFDMVRESRFKWIIIRLNFEDYKKVIKDDDSILKTEKPSSKDKMPIVRTPRKDCPDPHLRYSCWGDSISDVINVEGESDIHTQDYLKIIHYPNVTRIGSNGYDILYIFAQDKLVRAKYILSEDHSDDNKYLSDYDSLIEAMKAKYGAPEKKEEYWSNDLYKDDYSHWGFAVSLGHYSRFAQWKTEDTAIVTMCHGDNYEITVGVEYSSIKLGELEEKARKRFEKEQL